jgi:hypothetical protein
MAADAFNIQCLSKRARPMHDACALQKLSRREFVRRIAALGGGVAA